MIKYEKVDNDTYKKITEEMISIKGLNEDIAELENVVDKITYLKDEDGELGVAVADHNYKKQLEKESVLSLIDEKKQLLKEING